jgi:hypothetical protein
LQLSLVLAKPVSIYLTRIQARDPESRIKAHIEELVGPHSLTDYFEIPNAAGKLRVTADFSRRALDFSMMVVSPKNKTYATACINWLLRQIKSEDSELLIRANWPGRTPATMAQVSKLREDPNLIVPNGSKALPTNLEVVRVVDLAGKFQQKRKFVEIAEMETVRFYDEVCQHLRNWVPPAPKVKKILSTDEDDELKREEIRISSVED